MTPFSKFFTAIYYATGSTWVWVSRIKAMAPTFTKFSGLLGEIKG